MNEGNSWQLKLSPRTKALLAHYFGACRWTTLSSSSTKFWSSESIHIVPYHKCMFAQTHEGFGVTTSFSQRKSGQFNCACFRIGWKDRKGTCNFTLSPLQRRYIQAVCKHKTNHQTRIQSIILPPWMFPFWQMFSWINFPKRLELLL